MNGPAMKFHQFPGDGQAQACAAIGSNRGAVDLLKRPENGIQLMRWYSLPRILNMDHDNRSIVFSKDPYLPFFREFDRISDKVEKDLLQPVFIAPDGRKPAADIIYKNNFL
jgi:hypothetical protein